MQLLLYLRAQIGLVMSSGQARGAAATRFSSGRAASKAPGARSGAKPHGAALSLLPATLPASRLPPVNVFVNFSDSSFSSPCWGKRYIGYNPCVVLLFLTARVLSPS